MLLPLYALVVLIWGSTWIALKMQLGSVPVELSIAYRFGLAALVLFAWLLLARQLAPRFGGVMQKADEHYTMQDEDLTIPRPIEFCTGSFAAIRTDVFKTIGGFDPEYFMYVEDADLTQRALRRGLVYLLPQFTATHAWHRDPMRDAGKFKMQLKSMSRYFKKWGIGKGNV